MEKNAVWKWLILVALICGSLALVYPPQEKVTLGLDLQGGTSFIVEIDQERLRKEIQEREPNSTPEEVNVQMKEDIERGREIALEVIRNRVDGLGIAEPIIYSASYRDQERIIVQLPGIDEDKRKSARESIESVAFLEFRLVHEKSDEWTGELFSKNKAPKGFKISEQGKYYVRDHAAVKDEQMGRSFLNQLKKYEYHAGCEFLLEREVDETGREIYRPFYVEVRPLLKGDAVKAANVDYNSMTHAPYVSMEFNSSGATRFANITKNYAPRGPKNPKSDEGRQLAIVLDGTLYSAPSIREEIPSGRAQITGRFSLQESTRLANVLSTGSLPVPVRIVQTQTVDPTLGRDSIESGAKAAVIAFIAVLIFMLIYYMKAGVVANLALFVDMLLLPIGLVVASGFLGLLTGGSSFTGASVGLPTLTLPGIAGIVLTMGMAVDANVLIFERIREELNAGKRLVPAIAAGYEKAFSTIFDSNITTLVTAVILFAFGSGPIKGFAVTLTAGIVVSMCVVLIYTKMFFRIMTDKFNVTTLRMFSLVKNTNINFVGLRHLAIAFSLIVLVATWTPFFMRGIENNLGVDFTGGTALLYRFQEKQPVEIIRDLLNADGVSATIQYQGEMMPDATGKIREYVEIRVGENDGEKTKEIVEASLSQFGYELSKEDQVRGQVGSELRRKGIMAIIWAMAGIVLYITFRFEFGFAVGAIVALLHDVLITAGIYTLCGRQISLTVVAALLTIVGYSVNDTIVVFDRIREDLKLVKGKTFKEIANLSINQTLSRTVLTSMTTLISVLVLLFFGGGSIYDFALTLFIGIIVGTYSSIFVATPVAMLWHKDKKPMAQVTAPAAAQVRKS
ncbi:MAG: protein translocase subunit SecD [Kiritimatiellae bacterium]|nr:protein translocase subunit SecD [Kiritimatiellia bacterium]